MKPADKIQIRYPAFIRKIGAAGIAFGLVMAALCAMCWAISCSR